MHTFQRVKSAIDFLASLSMLVASACVLVLIGRLLMHRASTTASAALPKAPLLVSDASLKGNLKARVVLLEFSDFECPFCKAFARDSLPTLDEQYIATGKVLMAFRHFPLDIHADAKGAAQAAECASRQGHFWDMHDLIFAGGAPTKDSLRSEALSLHLDAKAFDSCIFGAEGKIKTDIAAGQSLEVESTPTFFIASVDRTGAAIAVDRLDGALPLAKFTAALDKALDASK